AILGFLIPRSLRAPAEGNSGEGARRDFVAVRSHSAMISSVLATLVVLFGITDSLLTRSGYGFWGACIWLGVAVLRVSAELFTAAQGLATVALAMAVTGICKRQVWWTGALW